MNIFWLSVVLAANAAAHCDQHVVKMPLEAVQLLYTAWAVLEPDEESWRCRAPLNKAGTAHGYRKTHVRHPLARWVRRSTTNYQMCADYALAVCAEYSKRYGGKQLHAEHHARWLRDNVPPSLKQRPMTPIPLCTGDGGKADTLEKAVAVYRRGYRRDKAKFARYRYSAAPSWMVDALD